MSRLVLSAVFGALLAFGAGCGASGERQMGGAGGSGGVAGEGGAGGLGGEGAAGSGEAGTGGTPPDLCGGVVCDEGEPCDRESGRPHCACTQDPDSCAPTGRACTSEGRCIPAPWPGAPCEEWMDVEGWGCLESFGWVPVRTCHDSSDCMLPSTVCVTDLFRKPVCWFNSCGDDNLAEDGTPRNGVPFGRCDVEVGLIEEGREPTGTCLPEQLQNGVVVFTCQVSGPAKIAEACRWDAKRGSDMLCEQGGICLGISLPTPACSTDDECDSAQACTAGKCAPKPCTEDSQCGQDRYCHSESKFCLPFQTCFEDCNAGSADIGTEYSACASSTAGCWGLEDDNQEQEVSLGYCVDPVCNLIEGGCEKDGEICLYAGFLGGAPLAGICGDGSKNTIPHREPCDPSSTDSSCEEGSVCDTPDGAGPGGSDACLVFCDCGEGWDQATGGCEGVAVQCNPEETCTAFWGLMSHPLGVCAPAGKEPGADGATGTDRG